MSRRQFNIARSIGSFARESVQGENRLCRPEWISSTDATIGERRGALGRALATECAHDLAKDCSLCLTFEAAQRVSFLVSAPRDRAKIAAVEPTSSCIPESPVCTANGLDDHQ